MLRLTALLLVSLMPLNALQETPGLLTDAESYAVYAAILPNEWPARIARTRRYVIAQETVSLERCKPDLKSIPDEWKAALLDYDEQNKTIWRLTPTFPVTGFRHVVVPRAEISQLFSGPEGGPNADWTPFYDAYPDSGGYYELSAVGFDQSRTRAIVYVSISCGSLCAGGRYQLMEKGLDGWRVVALPGVPPCIWVS